MRDPFGWSFPLGRLFGITIRVHLLFPFVALGMILHTTRKDFIPGTWADASMVMGLLFLVILLHEFGHCFAARRVGGDAQEILMWPLGGLAACDIPHSPGAHFWTAFGGPAVNLLICLVAALGLLFALDTAILPPFDPFWYPYRITDSGLTKVTQLDGTVLVTTDTWTLILTRLFWVSWTNFLLNVLIIGYPLDGGRMFQALLWPYFGYRQATKYAIYSGFFFMFVLICLTFYQNQVMWLALAWFIHMSCQQQWIQLETGGEDSLFGYDFSQGYTSLERDQERDDPPPPPQKKPGFIQRWLQRRAEKRRQRDLEEREAEERRMDELLDKIQRQGKQALTDEEQRFLKRVSERYKARGEG